MRKYNDFAPIGLKSGFENVIHQFDIEISLICGFAPQMGDEPHHYEIVRFRA